METRAVPARPANRLLYIDHIRVFLTILVILHHLMITYADVGGWDYKEGTPDFVTQAVGGWFCATNQAYFMGLFLLISAYFVPGSYDRKGAGRFLKDRLVRLGIPLAVYSWVIHPVLIYLLYREEIGTAFFSFYPARYFGSGNILGHGPSWFIELLLIFSLIYALWRKLTEGRPRRAPVESPFPGSRTVALFALAMGVATFLLRIPFPMDRYTFEPLNLQFPFFVSYIALFVLGLVAYRRNWLAALPDQMGRFWLRMAGLLLIIWPAMAIGLGAAEGNEGFRGGLHWESLVYTQWEAWMCMAAVIGLLYAFRRWLNREFRLTGFLVPNAYGAYLIHAPTIIGVAVAAAGIALYPLLKWAAVSLVAVPLCFAIAALIRKIPGVSKVL
ncbi:MAG: acyltransferase family protein [Anaerolineae bacterium]